MYTCQHIQLTGIKYSFFLSILGGDMATLENGYKKTIFMRVCCSSKLIKKTENLLKVQPTHTLAKCTLTGLVQ